MAVFSSVTLTQGAQQRFGEQRDIQNSSSQSLEPLQPVHEQHLEIHETYFDFEEPDEGGYEMVQNTHIGRKKSYTSKKDKSNGIVKV